MLDEEHDSGGKNATYYAKLGANSYAACACCRIGDSVYGQLDDEKGESLARKSRHELLQHAVRTRRHSAGMREREVNVRACATRRCIRPASEL